MPYDLEILLLYVCPDESAVATKKKKMYKNNHSTIIHNNLKVEATKKCTKSQVD